MSDAYCYPGGGVLRNRLGITDAAHLDYVERELVVQRLSEGAPAGDFDLPHLCAIHRHLFQDVYAWAGELRRVEIAKDGHQFQFRRFIEAGMADIHRRLAAADYLRGLDRESFARQAGQIIGDVNYVHPFREGNGRAQAEYLRQLGDRVGHGVDLARIDGALWVAASRAAHEGDYGPFAAEVFRVMG